jgi:hypothetical protein
MAGTNRQASQVSGVPIMTSGTTTSRTRDSHAPARRRLKNPTAPNSTVAQPTKPRYCMSSASMGTDCGQTSRLSMYGSARKSSFNSP